MADRKVSPLAGKAPWGEPSAAPPTPPPTPPPAPTPAPETGSDQRKQPDQPNVRSAADEDGPKIIPIGQRRRKRSSKALDPFDLVSFNCKLPAITRRELRKFAAEQDADQQDVVNDAIVRYLAEWGIRVPRTQQELEDIIADQR